MERRGAQLRLDMSSLMPAYRQVADQLRTFAVEGVIRPGDLLPPVRRLALELGVHFNTIAEAYRVLAQEGFLGITHGHRARVIDRTAPQHSDPTVVDAFRRRLRELIAGFRSSGMSAKKIAEELKTVAEGWEQRP